MGEEESGRKVVRYVGGLLDVRGRENGKEGGHSDSGFRVLDSTLLAFRVLEKLRCQLREPVGLGGLETHQIYYRCSSEVIQIVTDWGRKEEEM